MARSTSTENGSFVGTDTTYCRMAKMRATDLILNLLDTRWAARRGRAARSRRSEEGVRNLGAAASGGGSRMRLPSMAWWLAH